MLESLLISVQRSDLSTWLPCGRWSGTRTMYAYGLGISMEDIRTLWVAEQPASLHPTSCPDAPGPDHSLIADKLHFPRTSRKSAILVTCNCPGFCPMCLFEWGEPVSALSFASAISQLCDGPAEQSAFSNSAITRGYLHPAFSNPQRYATVGCTDAASSSSSDLYSLSCRTGLLA